MFWGIIAGFTAAAFQSLSYIFSRMFMARYASSIKLLCFSHLVIGFVAGCCLPFLWPDRDFGLRASLLPVISCALFYLLGQASFFMALKHTEASRVAPLLGLKIIFLALIASIFMSESFSYLQWIAVFLCAAAAFILNWSGKWIPAKAFMWVLGACVGFSLSDISIVRLIESFHGIGFVHRSLLSTCLCYILCGIIALAAFVFIKEKDRKMLSFSLPFAAAWLLAMIFLFLCFGTIGVVFGNIIQSSRGLISILLGVLIAGMGFLHIEEKNSSRIVLQRTAAAILMSLAIAIFCCSE